jgi:hypothetical protein
MQERSNGSDCDMLALKNAELGRQKALFRWLRLDPVAALGDWDDPNWGNNILDSVGGRS